LAWRTTGTIKSIVPDPPPPFRGLPDTSGSAGEASFSGEYGDIGTALFGAPTDSVSSPGDRFCEVF
jgi:hypothetical protein